MLWCRSEGLEAVLLLLLLPFWHGLVEQVCVRVRAGAWSWPCVRAVAAGAAAPGAAALAAPQAGSSSIGQARVVTPWQVGSYENK